MSTIAITHSIASSLIDFLKESDRYRAFFVKTRPEKCRSAKIKMTN